MKCPQCDLPEAHALGGGEGYCYKGHIGTIACLRRALANRDGEIAPLRAVGAAWAGECRERIELLADLLGTTDHYLADLERVYRWQRYGRKEAESALRLAMRAGLAIADEARSEVTRFESLLAIERGRVEGMQEGAEALKRELARTTERAGKNWDSFCDQSIAHDETRARLTAAEEQLLDAGEAVDASRATISDVRTALGGNATNYETKDIVELAEDVAGRLTAAEWDAGRMREVLEAVANCTHSRGWTALPTGLYLCATCGAVGFAGKIPYRHSPLIEAVLALSPPTGHAAGECALTEADWRAIGLAGYGAEYPGSECLTPSNWTEYAKNIFSRQTNTGESYPKGLPAMRAEYEHRRGHAAGEVDACPSTCASFQMEGGYALKCDCPAPVDEKGKAL